MTLVSLCMIMKNEEDELPLVIGSASGLADEIVIYDTGSTDRSVALARELGATVVEGYWDDDFSRARNQALEYCTSEWILWLDADEAVHGDKAAFRARLEREQTFDSYAVSIESLEGGGLGGRSAFQAARVFRRQRCHWFGPIHEQIGLRDGDAFPATSICSELRILHRGYTSLKWQSKDGLERNLRIARRALDDPEVDHSRALFDYGRTLAGGDDPRSAIASLREAADSTTFPMVRRAALRTIFDVHLGLNEFDEASETIDEMRRGLTKTINADVMDVRLLLGKKCYEACLEAIDRLPFADTDEDGFETGRASLSWAKAQALDSLGRPGDAADALLDALRTHGQLDVSLAALMALLSRAGRSASEIAQKSRPESMPVLVATASRLPAPEADEVLAPFAEAYPQHLEPLAAARDMASRLGVPRAMWWSNRFRRAGFDEMCPLLRIVRDDTREPLFRLLAAAGGYLSFRDQRLVAPAREALASISAEDRRAAAEHVSGISPELAKLLSSGTQAVRLSRGGTTLDGYLCYRTGPGTSGDVVDPGALPFGTASLHGLVAEDVLSSVRHDRAGAVLCEWARVLCDGGRLSFEVPNLAAVGELLAKGPSAELRRLLFGGRRFGEAGEEEANADAWSADELEHALSGVGFAVEEIDPGAMIAVTARRCTVLSRPAGDKAPPVCVLVISTGRADSLLGQLRSLCATDAGVDFETVVLVNGPDQASLALVGALEGDVTVATTPVVLDPAAAFDEAARLARADTVVALSPRARPVAGWLSRLVAPLADATVGMSGAAVLDKSALVVHAGFDLVGDCAMPSLRATPRSAHLRADVVLESDADVDALGTESFALRRTLWEELRGLSPGWSESDAVVDLCLRVRARGLRCVVAAGCTVTADMADNDPESRERLAWYWAGRTSLRPPPVRRVSASSLMPSSTLIERISTVMAVPATPRAGGVNLVGDFGESRTLGYAATLSAAGARVSRLQWAGGLPTPLDNDIPFAYSTTLLALDGDQLVDYVGEVGLDSLRNRRTAIAWDWPLAEPLAGSAAEASMVGEVWVPSTFSEEALKKVVLRPVLLVPPPVAVPHNATRSDARLPEGFVFAAIARLGRCRPGDEALANPLGTIEAFRNAFAHQSGPVLCVVLHGRKTRAVAEACRLSAAGRQDVVIIETDDPAVADAASVTADCLVSLHRSSAFGPDIARAVSVGCPVVSTGYGGPMDFLSEQYCELVGYEIVSIPTASYPFPAGTKWAEPDIDAAAEALRRVHGDIAEARRRAWQARMAITRLCGPKAATRAMRRRLDVPSGAVVQTREHPRAGAIG